MALLQGKSNGEEQFVAAERDKSAAHARSNGLFRADRPVRIPYRADVVKCAHDTVPIRNRAVSDAAAANWIEIVLMPAAQDAAGAQNETLKQRCCTGDHASVGESLHSVVSPYAGP